MALFLTKAAKRIEFRLCSLRHLPVGEDDGWDSLAVSKGFSSLSTICRKLSERGIAHQRRRQPFEGAKHAASVICHNTAVTILKTTAVSHIRRTRNGSKV